MPANFETVAIKSQNIMPKPAKAIPSPDINVRDKSVEEVARDILSSRLNKRSEDDQEDAFFVCDLGHVLRQHLHWKSLLPRIEPFFAIKTNPDPMVVKLLSCLGAGFDCASKEEIQQVLDTGVDSSRIIYANPCKQDSFIRYAAQQNVAKMTFDNVEELYKIKKNYPDAELVLRILIDDSKSRAPLGLKFGAPLDTVQGLLETANKLKLNVIGVSFHVGSGCEDESAFTDAVQRARMVFDQAKEMGFHFTLLDVGGGFPGADVKEGVTFEKIAAALGAAVDSSFPPEIRVIAEPGRFYVTSAFTLCVNIIGKRAVTSENGKPQRMYYLNDGIYGSFNCIIFDPHTLYPHILIKGNKFLFGECAEEDEYECSIWGPTCDSIDCLNKSTSLPLLECGDWLYYEDMGAYTSCAASQFNGFKKTEVFYTRTFY